MLSICVRKETKSKWERRTPVTPMSVVALARFGVRVAVEKSPVRVYPDNDYEQSGAQLLDSSSNSQVVVGIKEPPVSCIQPHQVHLCFSHTIKGQPHNMDLLRTLVEREVTLIDYEPMCSDDGERVAAVFSRFAGFSGTIETFRVLGKKLELLGEKSSFLTLKQPYQYERSVNAEAALACLAPLADKIRILIVGRGNVGQGCIKVCKLLGIPEIDPESLRQDSIASGPWFTVVDAPEIVRAKDGRQFDFENYLAAGSELYESTFADFLGKFDVLLQGAYWDERYPKQLPLELVAKSRDILPLVIGDISCDIDGTIACTTQASSIDQPAFTYNLKNLAAESGITLNGPTIMSIDNLPCELPADASDEFSSLLQRSLPVLASLDLSQTFETCGLNSELKRGTILYKGKFTKPFEYMQKFL